MLRILVIYIQRREVGTILNIIYKNNSKYIKVLNIRPKTIKLLEENIGQNLPDIGFGNDFFMDMTPDIGNKRKNRKIGRHEYLKI